MPNGKDNNQHAAPAAGVCKKVVAAKRESGGSKGCCSAVMQPVLQSMTTAS